MTKIRYDEENFCLTMRGHAGAAPAGRDLVCAALSTLMFTLESAVMERRELLFPAVCRRPGEMRVQCRPRPGQEKACREIYRTVFAGCELLGREYPAYVQAVKTGLEGY